MVQDLCKSLPVKNCNVQIILGQATTGIPTTTVVGRRKGLFLISSLFQMSFFLIYSSSWQEGAKRKAEEDEGLAGGAFGVVVPARFIAA